MGKGEEGRGRNRVRFIAIVMYIALLVSTRSLEACSMKEERCSMKEER